jgi:prepilin-type N-terminal cleavage/methylation domain-containing protein
MSVPLGPRVSGRGGFTLMELLVVIAIVGLAVALVVPGLVSSRRASNERTAATSLKTLTSAEADFRANDRDWNGVNDFWTGDVKGLHTMTPAKVRGAGGDSADPPIRLIELSVAAADLDGAFIPAGGENMELNRLAVPGPHAGYWYAALEEDQSLKAEDPHRPYREDTGGTVPMGKCHHRTQFGFIALPASSRKGKYAFIVNENNSIRRRATLDEIWKGDAFPPGREALPAEFRSWPSDALLKQFWSTAC